MLPDISWKNSLWNGELVDKGDHVTVKIQDPDNITCIARVETRVVTGAFVRILRVSGPPPNKFNRRSGFAPDNTAWVELQGEKLKLLKESFARLHAEWSLNTAIMAARVLPEFRRICERMTAELDMLTKGMYPR